MKRSAIPGLLFFGILLLGGLSQSALATTLTFDEFPGGTVLTTQYQSLGVTISGATVYTSCPTCLFPPVSGTNVAYAPSGLMTFSFNPTVVGGSVDTVSAYVTAYGGPAGIYAYDSSNNLLGQSLLPAGGGVNGLLSVTSSGNPIAEVTIHDNGGTFTIDNFSFPTSIATPEPGTLTLLCCGLLGLAVLFRRKLALERPN
jgi:hypothetical protein